MTIRKVNIKKDFDLNNTNSCVFHHSQWEPCRSDEHASIWYLAYRFFFMFFLVTSLTFSTLCQSRLFVIFLTNWSFTAQTLYGILSFFNIIWRKHAFLNLTVRQKLGYTKAEEANAKNYELKETATSYENMTDVIVHEDLSAAIGEEKNEDQQLQQKLNSTLETIPSTTKDSPNIAIPDITVIPNNNSNHIKREELPTPLEKFIWILMNVAHVLPHVVSYGYWIFVYKPSMTKHCVVDNPDQMPCEAFRSHYIVHSATVILAVIDSLVVAIPARITHFVFPTFIIGSYSLFSYLYELTGGPYRFESKPYIYSVLNWRHKANKATYMVVFGTIFSPFLHTITCWGFGQIRVQLAKRYRK